MQSLVKRCHRSRKLNIRSWSMLHWKNIAKRSQQSFLLSTSDTYAFNKHCTLYTASICSNQQFFTWFIFLALGLECTPILFWLDRRSRTPFLGTENQQKLQTFCNNGLLALPFWFSSVRFSFDAFLGSFQCAICFSHIFWVDSVEPSILNHTSYVINGHHRRYIRMKDCSIFFVRQNCSINKNGIGMKTWLCNSHLRVRRCKQHAASLPPWQFLRRWRHSK